MHLIKFIVPLCLALLNGTLAIGRLSKSPDWYATDSAVLFSGAVKNQRAVSPFVPVVSCPDSVTSCCQLKDQVDSNCEFDGNSCAIWKSTPSGHYFNVFNDGLGRGYAFSQCQKGSSPTVNGSAFLQSEEKNWTTNGRDTRLGFKYFIPSGLSEQFNVTVSAIFSTGRPSVILTTAQGTSFNEWAYSYIYLRNLGTSYALQFTAHTTCDVVIKLDDITIEKLEPVQDTSCIPTTTTTTTTTRPPPVAQSVSVQLLDFSYTPQYTKCDIGFGNQRACDTKFWVDYQWNQQLHGAVYGELRDSDTRSFRNSAPTLLDGPFVNGQKVVVNVVVTDAEQIWGADTPIANFKFEYVIPATPEMGGPVVVSLTDRWSKWYSSMTVEFKTNF